MNFNPLNVGKKNKQKLIRLSEKTDEYLKIIAEKINVSETDVINILINNVGNELEFIKKCENYLEKLNKEYDEKNNSQQNGIFSFYEKSSPSMRLIQYQKFLGFCSNYYPSNNSVNNRIFTASEYIDIYISRSQDKNFKYFVNFQKGISKIINPNTFSPEDHTDIYYTSDLVNDLYSYFKEKNINILNLTLDQNYVSKNVVS